MQIVLWISTYVQIYTYPSLPYTHTNICKIFKILKEHLAAIALISGLKSLYRTPPLRKEPKHVVRQLTTGFYGADGRQPPT